MNLQNTIISTIIQGAIALGPFAALLLFKKKDRQPFLISIILCLSLVVSHSFFVRGYIKHYIESPYIIAEPFIFLISPLFYFYFQGIASKKTNLSWLDLKHALPFIFFFGSFIPTYMHGQNTVYYNFMYSNKIVMTGFLWILLFTQFVFYYSKIYKLNKEFTLQLSQQHSNYEQFDASWIKVFLILFLSIFALVSIVLFLFLHNSGFDHFSTIIALFFSLQVYFVSYKGLNQKIISFENDQTTEIIPTETVTIKTVSDPKSIEAKKKLDNYMHLAKPYLNPDLTLSDLASQVNMSRNDLSALINNTIGSNFYMYINEFRVEHVKMLMQQDKNKQFTLLGLAFDSGFNSKSTFNALFKKITGITPTEYKQTIG